MRHLAAAMLAAAALLLAGPALVGPASETVHAHAQLVSSVPGAGERVAVPPDELRLAFTERLEPLGSSLDLLDGEGRVILRSAGKIEPGDPRTLTADVPALDEGLYTIAWRSLSADDGHAASGFFTFGVGEVEVPGTGEQTGGGIHAGHSVVHALVETLSRLASQLGAMLAFGLALVAPAVIRPLDASAGQRAGWWSAGALLLTAIGAAALLPLNAESVGVGLLDYATASDAGRLLVARTLTGALGGAIVIAVVRRRSGWAWVMPTLAGGLLAVALLATSGHATAFDSATPVLASIVHVGAAGVWLAGLMTLAWLAFGDAGSRRALLRPAMPRFSATALPAVALFGLSGLYLYWLMLRTPLDLDTGYGFLLALKLLAGLAAVAIGGLNYLGWRREGVAGEHRRVGFESALALGVVVITALLVSGSPPGLTRPIVIERASTTALNVLDAQMSLLPARPGPNRIRVTAAEPLPADATLALSLDRVDAAGGAAVELRPFSNDRRTFVTDVPLAADSRWDATVRLLEDGVEQARARWTFALDADGLAAGRAQPPIGPPTIVALLLAGLAILALLLAAAGVAPPRTDRRVARVALLSGAATGGALAVLMLLASPFA